MRPFSVTGYTIGGRSVTAATPCAARLGNTGNTGNSCTRAYRKRSPRGFQINIAGNSHQRDHCYRGTAGWRP